MPAETTYSHARAHLAALCDQVTRSQEPIIIHRRGAKDVALVDAAELRSLTETAHLLGSPRNAKRLISAIDRARKQDLPTQTLETLRRDFDLGQPS
jgi:antitoxin YefM